MLSKPASELSDWLGPGASAPWFAQVTVQQCLLGKLAGLPRALQRQVAEDLQQAARSHVCYSAHRARLAERRRSSWARALRSPLDGLAKALLGLYEMFGAHPRCWGPVPSAGCGVAIGDDPPRALALFPNTWEAHRGAAAQIGFAGYAEDRLTTSCTCRQKPLCGHLRVLLETLLDALYGDTALGAEAAEVTAVPTWQRLLEALGKAQASGAEPGNAGAGSSAQRERLAWRLGAGPDGLLVQPVVQQQNARGNWSPGRKLGVEAAPQYRRQASPQDRAALDAFAAGNYLRHTCGPAAAQLRILEALVDHPRLSSLEPPHEPLRLDKVHPSIAVTIDGGQLVIGLSVAGRRVSVEQLEPLLLDERCGVLFQPGRVSVFELPASASGVLFAFARYGMSLPPEAHERTAELLSSLSAQIPIDLPEALRGRAVPAESTLILRLSPQGERRLRAELRVQPLAVAATELARAERLGPDQAPGEGPLEVFGSLGQERVWARRELAREVERARAVAEQLGLAAARSPRWQLEGDAALELVHRARELAAAPEQELVVEWPAGEPWQTRSVSPSHLRVKVDRLGQWFEIGGDIEVDGLDASLALWLEAVRAKQRFVELKPGRFARIEEELATALRRIDELSYAHGKHRVMGPAAVPAIEALALPHLDCGAEWLALWARIAAASKLQPEPPSLLQAQLRPYQRDGYRWLARLSAWDAGACLADDMGLGKTVQCLAVLLSRPGPHLVVAPTSVGPNWLREAQAFAPSLRARLYRGADRAALLADLAPGDLLVFSYDLLAIDIEALREIEFDTLVLDEAQAVKNARTQRAQAARAVRARFKLALTGTPVENHLGELWSIFSIVSPGLLGPWEHFRDRFATPIERDGDAARLQALSRLVRPFMLRRTKAVVAPELPARTQVIEPVELSSSERALYELERRKALSELSELTRDERGRIQILATLTRLRRLACHPQLVVSDYRGRGAKLDTLLRLVEDLRESGQRALVFSQFTSFLALVRQALDERRIPHLYLDGQTPLAERSASVDAWQKGAPAFFLLSLKAGGSGLNLVGADAVIHLDPWWNPAVEDQATDRTHRIGQQRPVTAIRLITQGTIEEAVIALHEGKRALADGVLEGTEAAARLSSADLVELIRFGEGAAGMDVDVVEEGASNASPLPAATSAATSTATSASTREAKRAKKVKGRTLPRR